MMRPIRRLLLSVLLLLPMTVAALPEGTPTVIPATGWTSGACDIVTGNMDFSCFPILLAYLVQYLFGAVGMLALIHIMIAGYQWAVGSLGVASITSVDSAKKRLGAAIGGLLFCILVFAIMNFVIANITLGT